MRLVYPINDATGTPGNAGCSLADQMRKVPIVFAETLQQIRINRELLYQVDGPGLGVSLRVVHREVDFQCAEIWPAESLRYPGSIRAAFPGRPAIRHHECRSSAPPAYPPPIVRTSNPERTDSDLQATAAR